MLRSVDYGDSDRIVTLLTATSGKLACMARGARRSQKRFAGALEPFQLIEVELAPGSSGRLGRLAQARVVRAHPGILSSLERMNTAGEALELVREVVPDADCDLEVFAATAAMLKELGTPQTEPQALWVCFCLRLMALSGFSPRLDACGRCGKQPDVEQAALFDPRSGQLVCRECGGAPEKFSGRLRACLAQAAAGDWAGAARGLPRSELTQAHRAVHGFAEHRLERRLHRN